MTRFKRRTQGPEVSVQLPRQRVEPVPNELLDLASPCHSVSGFRISILRQFVSFVEMIAQVTVGIRACLDQISLVLVHLSRLRE